MREIGREGERVRKEEGKREKAGGVTREGGKRVGGVIGEAWGKGWRRQAKENRKKKRGKWKRKNEERIKDERGRSEREGEKEMRVTVRPSRDMDKVRESAKGEKKDGGEIHHRGEWLLRPRVTVSASRCLAAPQEPPARPTMAHNGVLLLRLMTSGCSHP